MKNTSLIAAFLFLFTYSNAQISKGTKFIAGSINLSYNNNSQPSYVNNTYDYTYNSSSFVINPSAGFFIKDNFAIGLGVSYGYSASKNKYAPTEPQQFGYYTSSENVSNKLSFKPYVRHYIQLSDKWYYFTNLVCELSSNNTDSKSYWIDTAGVNNNLSTTNEKGIIYGISIAPGCSYFVSEKLALDLTIGSLNYTSTTTKYTENNGTTHNEKSNGGSLNLSSASINFGLRYFIRKS